MKYVALLRGINVGGVIIKMADLQKLLEKAGYTDVQTILASGNVVFDSSKKDARKVAAEIEKLLETKYKRTIRVIVRPIADIEMLVKAVPYKGIEADKNTTLYATFLAEPPKSHLKTSSEFLRIVKTYPFAICMVLVRNAGHNSIDLMDMVTKHYGKDITTRNWNTIKRILESVHG